MIDRGSLSPDQLRTANGGRLKTKNYQSHVKEQTTNHLYKAGALASGAKPTRKTS
jgi:hypothetical protein